VKRPTAASVAVAGMALVAALPGTYVLSQAFAEPSPWLRLEPGQLAVVASRPGVAPRLLERAGVHRIAVPFEWATVVDARPSRLAFGLQGHPDGTAALRVRSRNGSIFELQDLEVHWQLAAGQADLALREGAGESIDGAAADPTQRERVRALAAAALRDAFGALDSEEVADAFRARSALEEARAELGQRLARHGLVLSQIVAPKPRFDREYEHAIEQRQLFEQERERLIQERNAFPDQERTMFEKTDDQLALAREALEGELAKLEAQAQAQVAALEDQAQRYVTSRSLAGAARRAELLQQAEGARAVGQAEAQALAAQIDSFAEHGHLAVREALIDRLGRVKFEIVPRPSEVRP
jgi:hypothetical protein